MSLYVSRYYLAIFQGVIKYFVSFYWDVSHASWSFRVFFFLKFHQSIKTNTFGILQTLVWYYWKTKIIWANIWLVCANVTQLSREGKQFTSSQQILVGRSDACSNFISSMYYNMLSCTKIRELFISKHYHHAHGWRKFSFFMCRRDLNETAFTNRGFCEQTLECASKSVKSSLWFLTWITHFLPFCSSDGLGRFRGVWPAL